MDIRTAIACFQTKENNSRLCYAIVVPLWIYSILCVYLKRIGFELVFYNAEIVLFLFALLSVSATVFISINRNQGITIGAKIVTALSFPSAVVNTVCIYLYCNCNNIAASLFCITIAACTVAITFCLFKSLLARIFISLAIAPLIIIILFSMLFSGIREDTVTKRIDSPDNSYTALIISSDQGAMGGDTFVNIEYNNKRLNLLIGEIKKIPKTVYSGDWGEEERLNIYWIDDHTLSINGKQKLIK